MKHLNRPQLTHQLNLLRHRVDPQHGEARCYLSGPMTGLPYFNFHAFEVCAERLRDAGWFVFSPRENDAEAGIEPNADGKLTGDSVPYKSLMAKDLHQVCSSDAVIVMPGWEWSEGCLLEVEVAHRVNVPVFTYLHQREIAAEVRAPHEFSSRAGGTSVVRDRNLELASSLNGPAKRAPADILDCGPKVRFRDPDTGGEKEESEARFDLVPPDALTELARVYGMGAQKYEPGNYLKGYPWHLSIAALERHVQKFKAGEDIDPESGLHHLAHAAWQCFTLVIFGKRMLGTDDRMKVGRGLSWEKVGE